MSEAFKKLSPKDRRRALDDIIIWGKCYIRDNADGSAELLDPATVKVVGINDELLKEAIGRRRAEAAEKIVRPPDFLKKTT